MNMKEVQIYPRISPKVSDMEIPGVQVQVTPDVAEEMGAFEETALSEADAWDSVGDVILGREVDYVPDYSELTDKDLEPSHVRNQSLTEMYNLLPGESLMDGLLRQANKS